MHCFMRNIVTCFYVPHLMNFVSTYALAHCYRIYHVGFKRGSSSSSTCSVLQGHDHMCMNGTYLSVKLISSSYEIWFVELLTVGVYFCNILVASRCGKTEIEGQRDGMQVII